MADFCHFLTIVSKMHQQCEYSVNYSVNMGWVVATTKEKKQDDTNDRVQCGRDDAHMYIQWVSISLQALDKHVLYCYGIEV